VKGTVDPKLNSLFTHLHVIPIAQDFRWKTS